MKKLFRFILLVLTMTLLFSVPVFADGGGTGNGTGSGLSGTVDPNASSTGVSKNRSGYLVYLANKDTGAVTSPVVLVPYNAAPASSVNTDYVESRLGGIWYSGIYNGNIATATNGEFTSPPFTIDGGSFGTQLKNKLVELNSNGDAKVYDLIGNVLGAEYKTQFKDNDERLVIEAVAWTGFTSGGRLYAYTAKTGAQIANSYGYTYLSRFWKERLPKCGYLQHTWCGVPAPTVPSGSIAYSEVISKGYGLIMIAPSDTPDDEEEQPVEASTDDYLKADELNYSFPDFIKSSTDGRSEDMYSNSFNMGASSVWNNHTGTGYQNSALKDNKWSVSESITSDLVSFYGKGNCLFYRATAGQWANPSATKEFAGDAGDVYPGYGYTYSRAIFGDNLIVCDYKGNGKNNETYINTYLKMNVGHSQSSGLSSSANTEYKSSITKSGSYEFKGKCTESYEAWEQTGTNNNGTPDNPSDDYPEYGWVAHTEDNESESITYNTSHGIYKYSPLDLGTSTCLSSGDTLLASGRVKRALTRAVFSSEIGTVSLYPEVKYTMYKMSNVEEWSNPQEVNEIYCMGEKLRTSTGGTLHGYKVGYSYGTNIQGKSIVDAPLTGTAAFEWVDNFGDNSQDYMQVCSQGSGFEVATTNNPIITCTSFTLDLYNGNVSTTSVAFNPANEWERPDSKGSHESFVNALSGNLTTEVYMKRFSDKTSSSQVGTTDIVSYDISNTNVTPTTTEQIRIKVRDGIIYGKDSVISRIASAYGITTSDATQLWNNWGIESQILQMLETSQMSNNNSGSSGKSASKWYDEETECLAITINTSVIQVGNILFDDKMDYGSSTNQSATSFNNLGTTGYQCRFYFSLGFINSSISVDGQTFDLSDKIYLIDEDEILGARFLISNTTTNNWRK